MPVAVLTAAGHRAGKRIGDALVDDGWDLGFWSLATMQARVARAKALVGLSAVKVVYIGAPAWDPSPALAWCAAHQIDAVNLDATRKVHDLTPTVAAFLAS